VGETRLVRSQLIHEARSCIGRIEGIVRQEIVGYRIEAILRNHIPRKRRTGPGSIRILPDGGWIVNRIPNLLTRRVKEIEVAVQHVRARHVEDGGLGGFLMMTIKAEQPECLVLAVVNFRYENRSAQYSGEFVIGLRRRQESIEVIAMQQRVIQIPIFETAVELVGPAAEDDG